MKYRVIVKRWTPDDYVNCFAFECRWMFLAKIIKWGFHCGGWQHIDIITNSKER